MDLTFLKYYKPQDFIDKRRGLAKLFNFCPLCGKRIDWKNIRKLIKEEIKK